MFLRPCSGVPAGLTVYSISAILSHAAADPEAAVLHRVELERSEGTAGAGPGHVRHAPPRRAVRGHSRQCETLKGFGGAGVLEIIEDHDGDTYRCVYTVTFRHAVYVLHVFQKKSKRGIATPRQDLDLVRNRYHIAARHYAALEHQEDRHA